nr:metallophosphoesterase family protein [uncultured Devosia sp.]
MRRFIQRLLGRAEAPERTRPRLNAVSWPALVYAIGDVHGCLKELEELERRIVQDGIGVSGDKWIVMLGDYVDRGPASAAVLDRLCSAPPAGFRRICLAGNHETMMLKFLRSPSLDSDWLRFGGMETLASYGIDIDALGTVSITARRNLLGSHIPNEHIDLLESLPTSLQLPGIVFAHAGVRPGIPLEDQTEADLLWIREPFLSDAQLRPFRVVHGHTPVTAPEVLSNRIGIDTGAFATGVLTALRLDASGDLLFLNTSAAKRTLTK